MIIQPIDYFLLAWFALAVSSAAYVAYDQFSGNPEAPVMKWGFVLITLYMGPIGLLLYIMTDKEPRPGEHETFIQPLWKQSIGSTIHCCAGDATGIIAAAAITASFGLPMWIDLIVEYVIGFAFGLFIFQALFMRKMMGGSYLDNVRRMFLPELLSMSAMMAGMAPVMSLLMMGRDMRAMQPTELLFWGVMSLGVIVGFTLAYPVNVWMVAHRMKHGLMTVRSRQHASRAKRVPAQTHGHEKHDMGSDVTGPQLAAVTGVTLLALAAGMLLPAIAVNLRLGAHDVGDSIMPPGMIMGWDTPGDAMRDMRAVRPRDVAYVAAENARGDAPLDPRLESGTKTFELTASVIRWTILPRISVEAYAFNQQVPGPRLHLTEGDRVRIHFVNHLPEPTTIHWHGLVLPNAMDGPAEITQPAVPPGGEYTYEFTATQSGTYFYHTHARVDRQQSLGLYGALLIDPKSGAGEPRADLDYVIQLQEWLYRQGLTYPAMPMEGAFPNYFTINGKAYPATETIHMKVGQKIRLRFIGSNNIFIHPMHVHGGPFTVIARDGNSLAPNQWFEADTVNVGPGQRYDVIWPARGPGKWLVHCHIGHHTTNNNTESQGGGGLMLILDVAA